MFAAHLATLRENIGSIRQCLITTERLRRLARAPGPPHTRVPLVCPFEDEAARFPSTLSWRIFDHCAAVTRLYAVYERFATELLETWLTVLPTLYTKYEGLPESIQRQHRDGIANILPQIGEGRYDHLTLGSVVNLLNECLSGEAPYRLQPEAFSNREKNLRSSILDLLFSRAGIQNCWSWIQHHKGTRTFLIDVLGSSETAASELNTFVTYRNEAAHGDVTDVLDLWGLLSLTDFVDVVCEALAERVQAEILAAQLASGTLIEVGEVTEAFPRINVVVAVVSRGNFSVGQELTVAGRRYCFNTTIRELQLNDVSHENVFVHASTEIGIKLDRPLRTSAKIYQDASGSARSTGVSGGMSALAVLLP